ncbi:MAG TPA: HAMP domain-containing protein, partial [Vicinamibacteria bacterium]|nr:HAMP domain-containing protein [Vicinamibacteria bacterium]
MSRLYSRIYLHLLGVLLVVGLAASLLFALGGRGALQRQLAERLVRHVGSLVAESLDDRDALERRLQQLRADLEVDVTARGLDGRMLAAAGPELRALGEDERAALRAGELITRPGPTWFVAAAVRAPGSGAVTGFVEVSAPRRLSAWGLWRPAAGVLAVLLVIALAAGPLARRISRPVERLTEGARRLGAGELGHRVSVDPPRRRRGLRRWRRHGGGDELV